jgi:hypothetical protein
MQPTNEFGKVFPIEMCSEALGTRTRQLHDNGASHDLAHGNRDGGADAVLVRMPDVELAALDDQKPRQTPERGERLDAPPAKAPCTADFDAVKDFIRRPRSVRTFRENRHLVPLLDEAD